VDIAIECIDDMSTLDVVVGVEVELQAASVSAAPAIAMILMIERIKSSKA